MEAKAIPHGTANGYVNHGCRCPKCADAWREYHGARYRLGQQRRTSKFVCKICGEPGYAKERCKRHYEHHRRTGRDGQPGRYIRAADEAPGPRSGGKKLGTRRAESGRDGRAAKAAESAG